MDALLNIRVRRDPPYEGMFESEEYMDVAAFFDAHRELSPTPLLSLRGLAAQLSLGEVLIKDETGRFGLEAFKIVGARYAVERIGRTRLSRGVVCATAGNHGRAVARAARDLDLSCTVFLPAPPPEASELELRTRGARIAAMQADGARTLDVNGTYEAAVRRAAVHARTTGATVVSDTSWPGYDEIPRRIMLGYTHIFDEAARQWTTPPDILLVQGGVGGLVCAAANWLASRFRSARPFLIACEPEGAACLLESARAECPVQLQGPLDGQPETPNDDTRAGGRVGRAFTEVSDRAPAGQRYRTTMMAGLRCATPSPAAWPSVHAGVDAFLSIPDSLALEAMDRLVRPIEDDPGISAGPSGGCGVGALLALLAAPAALPLRQACGLGRSTRAMAIVTEAP